MLPENDQAPTRSRALTAASRIPLRETGDENQAVRVPGKTVLASKQGPTAQRRAALSDMSNLSRGTANTNRVVKKGAPSRSKLVRSVVAKKAVATTAKQSVALAGQGTEVSTQPGIKAVPRPRQALGQSATFQSKKIQTTDAQETAAVALPKEAKVEPAQAAPDADGQVADAEPEALAEPIKCVKPVEPEWDDLDAEDADDPLMVSEYVVEIFEYLKQQETTMMPNPNYMDAQRELKWNMRGILIDWLIEVHGKFHLLPETLFLTVNLIDRFLSKRIVSLVKLQLVGIAAMFIASKFEEVMAPSVNSFVYMADSGYTAKEVLKAERYMLQVLSFRLTAPNPMNFLRRISKADNYDVQTRTVAKYLMEIPLVDQRFLSHPWSKLSAAAMHLAREMLGRGDWNGNLQHYSGYATEELLPIVKLMRDYLQGAVKHKALFEKYAHKKFLKASMFVRDWISKHPLDPEQ